MYLKLNTIPWNLNGVLKKPYFLIFLHSCHQTKLTCFFNIISRLSFLFFLSIFRLLEWHRDKSSRSIAVIFTFCVFPPYVFCELVVRALLPRPCSLLLSPIRFFILIFNWSFHLLMSVIVFNVFRLRKYIFFFECRFYAMNLCIESVFHWRANNMHLGGRYNASYTSMCYQYCTVVVWCIRSLSTGNGKAI